MIDVNTWTLLVVLFGFLVCCLAASCAKIRYLSAEIDRREAELHNVGIQLREAQAERDTAISRDDARRCHFVRIADEEADRLRRELLAVKAKNRFLESALEHYWPGAKGEEI